MRIGTLRLNGALRPVALEGEELVELDSASVKDLLAEGPAGYEKALRSARGRHPCRPEQLAPAIPDPGKILCIGRNYADHAAETGHTVNPVPDVFMRAATSLLGPFDPVRRPRVSDNLDFEVELAIVIGRGGRYLEEPAAMGHIAGYAVFNDYSIRDFQHAGTQWIPGKNFDGTGPLGPFLVTADEVPDPNNLAISLTIRKADGSEELMQNSNTSLLMHKLPRLVSYCSQFTTLEPGDVIATGTPSGVGTGRTPKRWLVPGETVISRVEGIGELKNQVLEEAGPRA